MFADHTFQSECKITYFFRSIGAPTPHPNLLHKRLDDGMSGTLPGSALDLSKCLPSRNNGIHVRTYAARDAAKIFSGCTNMI
jgi:hypothetical protein